MSEELEMENLTGSEEGTEDGEGSSQSGSEESGSGSGSSEEGEESGGEEEEEDEDEPVLKYKRFAKEVVSSINDPRASNMPVHICCIAVHPKVRKYGVMVAASRLTPCVVSRGGGGGGGHSHRPCTYTWRWVGQVAKVENLSSQRVFCW